VQTALGWRGEARAERPSPRVLQAFTRCLAFAMELTTATTIITQSPLGGRHRCLKLWLQARRLGSPTFATGRSRGSTQVMSSGPTLCQMRSLLPQIRGRCCSSSGRCGLAAALMRPPPPPLAPAARGRELLRCSM
jgi:hypothetical protein